MPVDQLEKRYLGILLDGLAEARYPSAPMLDRIEASITDRQTAEAYIGSLLDRLSEDRFPSPPMVDRVRALLSML